MILQLTSEDANCTFCVPANPRFDEIARETGHFPEHDLEVLMFQAVR